uniref:Uncharacterized protein n=1 Tax=Ditylenchus dipsaci TaxID=166011 RepID=A0A915DUW4_9BILA
MSWLNRMRHFPQAFEQTSTLVMKFRFEPKLEVFEELLNNVPLPSVQRLEIDYKLDLPVRQDAYFFNYKIFHNCRSIHIYNKRNVGLLIKADDVVQWLHADPSISHPKSLNVAIYLTAGETEKLLNDLKRLVELYLFGLSKRLTSSNLVQLFREAITPCSYFLTLRGYPQSGATEIKRNEVTQESWQARCIHTLECLTVKRTS